MAVRNIKLSGALETKDFVLPDSDASILFHKLFQHSPQGAALADREGKILKCNSAFIRQVHSTNQFIELERVIRALQSNNPAGCEVKFSSGKGSIRASLIPLIENQKDIKWIVINAPINSDSAATKLISLKNLYRSFIDNSFEILFRSTEDNKLVFLNRICALKLGLKAFRQLKEKHVLLIFEDEAHYTRLKEKAKNEKIVRNEIVFLKRIDGKRLICIVNCQLYNNEYGAPTYNWTALDITEYKEWEQHLQLKNEQLAKVNNQMEKFLYSTSHDLRSPITTIMGLVNLIRMETADAVALAYASKIETSAYKLDRIIKDIMNYSRTTYQRIRSEHIDFGPTIWKLVNKYQDDPSLSKIKIDVRMEGESQFYNDVDRVELAIDNVIRNAINYYDQKKVHPFIKIQVDLSDKEAKIQIADNGIGIGKDHCEQIFTMFYKATSISKGAGLGLFIGREALEQLKGSISVESEVGFGSVFHLTIPNDHKGKLINRKLHLQQHIPD